MAKTTPELGRTGPGPKQVRLKRPRAETTYGLESPRPKRAVTDVGRNHLSLESLHIVMDIQKSIFGYPVFNMILGYPLIELWISKNRIMDIQYSI